jgi:tetratricopeptide (TPR) repeat protein
MNYKIVRRINDRIVTDQDYGVIEESRNYHFPLCGFGCYKLPIKTGDVVGLRLKTKTPHEVEGIPYLKLTENGCKLIPKKIVYSDHYEERLFRIIGKVKRIRHKYTVEEYNPLNKVIRENVGHVRTVKQHIPLEYVIHDVGLTWYYLENVKGLTIRDKFEKLAIKHLIDSLETNDHIKGNWRLYSEYLYKKQFYHANEELINKLYDMIERHIDLIDDPNKHNILTRDEVIQTNRDLIKEARNYYKDGIDLDISYGTPFNDGTTYTEPLIPCDLHTISYMDIYRVYVTTPDPLFAWCHTNCVTNWGGIILEEDVRQHLQVGHIVRAMYCLKEKFFQTEEEKRSCDHISYFELLHKIDDYRFLAKISNQYMDQYDNIVVVLDIRAISEIPITWNDGLEKYDKKEGDGFSMTGMYATKLDTHTLHDVSMWLCE